MRGREGEFLWCKFMLQLLPQDCSERPWWEERTLMENERYRDKSRVTDKERWKIEPWPKLCVCQRSADDRQPHYSHLSVSGWIAAHLFWEALKFRPGGSDLFTSATSTESDDKQQRRVNLEVWVFVRTRSHKDDKLNVSSGLLEPLLCF